MYALLFDLGGTFLRAAVAGAGWQLQHLARTRISSVAGGFSEEIIWRRILESMLRYEADHFDLLPPDAPVILSFPGPIADGCRVVQAPTVAGSSLDAFNLPSAVERATGRPVRILNDVSAAAWHLAETNADSRFLVVTVSSGIGSKIFDRCHPAGVIDQPPYAGEIGHVVVDDRPDAPVCDCGGRGHLGAIASGRGIERLARQVAACSPQTFLESACVKAFGATSSSLCNEQHIVPAVLAGDKWATGLVTACTRPLARTLLTVTMACGLERIFVIGGFASALASRYIEILKSLAVELCGYDVACDLLPDLFVGVPITEETSLAGCAAYLRRSLGKSRFAFRAVAQ